MFLLTLSLSLTLSQSTAADLPLPTGLVGQDDPWAIALDDADELRRHRRPLAASARAADILGAQPPPEVRRQARLSMAMSLRDLGMLESSRDQLLRVVADGADDPATRAALVALLRPVQGDAASELMVLAPLLPAAALDGETARTLPAGPGDALRYARALDHLDADELAYARRALAAVHGPLSGRAHALAAAVAHQQGDVRAAAESLGRAIGAADETGDRDLRDQASLQAGRLLYGLGRPEESARFYSEVAPGRPLWADAREEQAWAYFRAGEVDRALGNAVALTSPWRTVPTPEVQLITGIARLETCRFDEAARTAEQLAASLRPTVDALGTWLSYAQADSAFDDWFGARDGVPGLGDAPVPRGVLEVALRDRELAANARRLAALDAELETILSQKTVWVDAVGAALADELARSRTEAATRAGDRLIVTLRRQHAHLNDVLGQADVLAFEAVDGQRRMLEELARRPAPDTLTKGTDIDFAVATDLVYWPFNGEFWADEIDSYRVEMPSLCDRFAAAGSTGVSRG